METLQCEELERCYICSDNVRTAFVGQCPCATKQHVHRKCFMSWAHDQCSRNGTSTLRCSMCRSILVHDPNGLAIIAQWVALGFACETYLVVYFARYFGWFNREFRIVETCVIVQLFLCVVVGICGVIVGEKRISPSAIQNIPGRRVRIVTPTTHEDERRRSPGRARSSVRRR
jgi:hypothetical protein